MGLTVNRVRGPKIVGDLLWAVADVAFDSSYPTGGESLTPADFGFNDLEPQAKMMQLIASPKSGMFFQYDFVNSKLLAYLGATDSSGLFVFAPGGGDLKGATAITGAMATADQAADAVNAGTWVAYQTFTTVSGAAGSLGSVTAQPGTARNCVITVKNDQGGATTGDLFTGTQTFTVTGTFRGAAQVETIALTVSGGQKTVADTKFRAVAGIKPFDTITSIACDHAADVTGALKVGVGPGTLIGLPIAGDTGTDADVIKATLNAANYSVTGKTNWTTQTIDTGTTADGNDFSVEYLIDADSVSGTGFGTSAALPQVPASTNLSTVTTRVLAWAAK